MTKKEALSYVSDGHSFMSIEGAKEVCEAFDVPFNDKMVERYANQKEANPTNSPKGLWLDKPNEPIAGVATLRLSCYITDYLKLDAGSFIGRGFQAQANATVVAKHFGL